MMGLLKLTFIALCGCLLTAGLLGVVLFGVLRLEPGSIIQKMNSSNSLYVLPLVILFECCFFANDLLAYLSRRFNKKLVFDFSEMGFRYDFDNYNRLVPLGTKISQLYPITIAIVLVGFAVVVAR